MNVLLDARSTRRMSAGMRAYSRELAARIPRVAPDIALTTIQGGENFTLHEQISIPRAARAADLVHFPTIYAPLALPPRYVLTVHDLIHLRFPELFGAGTSAYYALVARRLARRAHRIIVGDARTVGDCIRFLGVRPERIRVVPLGYDPGLLAIPAEVTERPYVLYAGNHRAHKNLAMLVEAWEGLPSEIVLDLALTGRDDLGVRSLQDNRRLDFLGDLAPEALAARLRGATALIQPSLTEGYGLPVLEALARATPVIASRESVPQALVPYAGLFTARDIDGLRSLLEEVARSPQRLRGLAAEGEPIARAYTWDRFAASTAHVYRDALEDFPNS